MELGIFTKVFLRDTLEKTLDAVRERGLACVQLNLETVCGAPMPSRIKEEIADRIRQELTVRGIALAAVSGTFNMIHPNQEERRRGMNGLRGVISSCKRMGTSLVTLCTGTRDPKYMWRRHPENHSPAAWRDMVASMAEAVEMAEKADVTLVFEPEVSNVVDSAKKARRLLDEIRSVHLKVVMDGANLYHAGELPKMREILNEAFDLLGPEIALAHAKDLDRDGEAGHIAAGTGLLDYEHYLSLLKGVGFEGGLILHSLKEEQVEASKAFVEEKLKQVG